MQMSEVRSQRHMGPLKLGVNLLAMGRPSMCQERRAPYSQGHAWSSGSLQVAWLPQCKPQALDWTPIMSVDSEIASGLKAVQPVAATKCRSLPGECDLVGS